jgi:hypothetical protein
MNCVEYQESLQEKLDGAHGQSDAARQHVRECSSCRELHQAAQRLLDGLGRAVPPTPSLELTAAIRRNVLGDMHRRRWQRRLLVSAAAAAVLLAASLGIARWRSPASPVAQAVLPLENDTRQPSLRQSVERAGIAVAALTRRAANETLDESRFLFQVSMPDERRPQPAVQKLVQDAGLRPLTAVKDGVSEGLEPVATSARRAVRLFWRDLEPVDHRSKANM